MTLVRYVDFAVKGDELGWLVAPESDRNVPFPMKRVYCIFGTRSGVRRGKHAHRQLTQMMVCLAGHCTILLDDGTTREYVSLTRNDRGLMLYPMIWHEMYDFSPDSVLLVLADNYYDGADYIRDYDAFKAACA